MISLLVLIQTTQLKHNEDGWQSYANDEGMFNVKSVYTNLFTKFSSHLWEPWEKSCWGEIMIKLCAAKCHSFFVTNDKTSFTNKTKFI